jgi:hypothetical protein
VVRVLHGGKGRLRCLRADLAQRVARSA